MKDKKKVCEVCGFPKDSYIDFVNHRHFTVKEWKKFNKLQSAIIFGNDMTFFNFQRCKEEFLKNSTEEVFEVMLEKNLINFSKFKEAQEYVTGQEILLSRHKIILTNYRDRKYVKTRYPNDRIRMIKVGETCPTPLKEKLEIGLRELPSKMTGENLSKGFKKFNKFMSDFDKAMSSFSKGLGGNSDPNFWYGSKSKIDLVNKSSNKGSLIGSKKEFFSKKKPSKKNSKKVKKESW